MPRSRVTRYSLLVISLGCVLILGQYSFHWTSLISSSAITNQNSYKEIELSSQSSGPKSQLPGPKSRLLGPKNQSSWQKNQFSGPRNQLSEPKRSSWMFNEMKRYWRSPNGLSTNAAKQDMLLVRLHDDYTYCPWQAPFVGPFRFIEESKNPCWWDDDTLRCVPYFMLAGFSKCGTSDLYFRISRHPFVVIDKKERHWFDYLRYFEAYGSIKNYTDMFQKSTNAIRTDMAASGDSEIIVGDGTPCSVWYSLYWRCYEGNEDREEPLYTNADVIYRMNPNMKVIILLREPAARLYSRFLTHIQREGTEHVKAYRNPSPESFHQVVANAVAKYRQCFQQWSPRHCAYNGTLYTEVVLRLQEGMYSVFIKDWMKVFPREQLLFLRFEDYSRDSRSFVEKVFSFLNLPLLKDPIMDKIMEKKRKNIGDYDIGPMLEKTRKLAQNFYRPFNLELAKILQDEKYLWQDK